MISVAISTLLILLAAVEAISFEVKGIKFGSSLGILRMTTQVDDGVQQRYDFTNISTFGEKKKK